MNIPCKRMFCVILLLLCVCFFTSCSSCNVDISSFFSEQNSNKALPPVSKSTTPSVPSEKPKVSEGSDANAVVQLTEISTPYYEKTELNYGYEHLTNVQQKELYEKMFQSVYLITDETTEKGQYKINTIHMNEQGLRELDIRIVMEAFVCDHPEFFWISNSFGYSAGEYITDVNIYSFLSIKQVNKYEKELISAVKKIVDSIPNNLSLFERELYIHDALLSQCSYDREVTEIRDDPMAFSIYGALINNKAVCEGYSKTVQYLLSVVGIESITVNGESKNDLHQWNLVNLDGSWYHLDATWDDSEQEYITYSYFNISDELIKEDHIISKDYTGVSEEEVVSEDNYSSVFNLVLPTCSSMTENFYTKKAVTFTDFDSEITHSNMINSLYNAAQSMEENFFIKLDDSLDFNDTLQKLFYKEPYKFFDYINIVNKSLDVKVSDSLSMTSNKYQKTIQVFLKYE